MFRCRRFMGRRRMKAASSQVGNISINSKAHAWASLASGVVIFAGQWWAHAHYIDRINWVDRSPSSVNELGALLTVATLLLGLVSLPRWQSFLALLAGI